MRSDIQGRHAGPGRSCVIGFLLLALSTAPTAFAGSWLAGAAAGNVKQHNYSVGGPIARSDDTDTGFRVFAGYMFLPWLGGVLSYVDLGTPNYDGPAFGGFTDKLDADAVDLSLIAAVTPGEQEMFSIFATVGAFRFNQNVHYTDESGAYDYHDTGTRLSYGLGVQWKFNPAWGAHLGWQRFTDVGDNNNSEHEYDRDVLELGLEFNFGR